MTIAFPMLSQPVRRTLLAMLGLALLSGVISGSFEARHGIEPAWSELTGTFLLLVLMIIWYHIDSTERHFKRSVTLTVAIIGVAIIGIPYYVIRSRARGKKLAALLWAGGFAILLMALNSAGEYLAIWVL